MGIVFLIVATVCCAMFPIFFKVFQQHDIDNHQAIFYNYVVAFILGLIFSFDGTFIVNPLKEKWLGPVAVLGFIFIAGMMLLSRSTRRVGVAISTVCSRASMVIAIILSYHFVAGSSKPQWIPIALVIVGMSLVIWTGRTQKSDQPFSIKDILLPFGVFLCFGFSNGINKIIQDRVVIARPEWTDDMINRELSLVSACIFLSATLFAAILIIHDRRPFKWRNVVGGICFGTANYVCTYTLMLAMKTIDTTILFPIHNLGIVAIGALVGWLCFKEKMRPHQIAGLVLATGAICWLCL